MTSDDAFFGNINGLLGQKGLETLQGTRTCYRMVSMYTLAKFYSSASYIEMYGMSPPKK